MHGMVSLLDQKHYDRVEIIWQTLETRCGLTGIQVTPFPHFSWLIADDFSWSEMEPALQSLAAAIPPFKIRTTGIGIFSSERPVVYIPVVRTAALDRWHDLIWEKIMPVAAGPSDDYSSEQWVPHISLAYKDVTRKNIGCIMETLARQELDWEIEINNLALIYEPVGTVGSIRYHYSLSQPA